VALLRKGWKAAAAVVLVAVLSLIVIIGNITGFDRRGLLVIYAIGAGVGLAVSVAATLMLKFKVRNLRAKSLILTIGALFGGGAFLSMAAVSEPLAGQAASDTGLLILNYALGYFMVGVSADALRVRKALGKQKSAK